MSTKSLNHFVAKAFGKLTLRTVLIVPFVLQIFGTVGLVGYLSFRNGQQAVNDVATQLRSEISERVEQYLQNYLKTPHLVNKINADAIRLGLLDVFAVKDTRLHERYFWQQLQAFDSVSYIAVANKKGGMIGASRQDDGTLNVYSTEGFASGNFYIYSADGSGNRKKLLSLTRNYDTRVRPWYKTPAQAGKPTWSEIYSYVGEQTMGISAGLPFYDKTGAFGGVLATDLVLSQISTFLQGLKVGRSGKTFIIERSGLLVASCTYEKLFVPSQNNQESKRIKATESRIPLIRNTAEYLTKRYDDFSKIDKNIQLTFAVNGKLHFLQVTPLKDGRGIDWLIVVVVPEADFMDKIHANTRTTIVLCIAALIVATVFGILTARWVTQPIMGLNKSAKALATGEWEETVEINRSDDLGELAKSFNSMAHQLQASFSEMKALNEALSQSESRLKQFLEAVPVCVTVHDATGQLYYTNRTAAQLLGIQVLPEAKIEQLAEVYQVYRAGTEQLYPTDNLPLVRSLRGESVKADDLELRQPDKNIPLEIFTTPIFDETGKIVYAIAAFIDITERKQASKLLADYNHTLECQVQERTLELERETARAQRAEVAALAANRAKSAFLANMSHELRTPLNAILGFSQLMSRSPRLNLEHQEHLHIITRNGEHLLTLINQVLDLSKIEAGRTTLNETCFDLHRLLSDLQDMFQLKALNKGLQLLFNRSPDVLQYVRSDEVKLRQVLINLLSNAIKFTQEGRVSVRVSVVSGGRGGIGPDICPTTSQFDKPARTVVSSNKQLTTHSSQLTTDNRQRTTDNGQLTLDFEIEDTGPGIAPEELDSLFEAFVQTKTGQQSQQGTGLGLTIARSFVQLMGGEMSVSSLVGRGTVFKFDLQVSVVEGTDIKSKQPTRRVIALDPKQQNYMILIVDDLWDNRQLLIKLLSPLGFEVLEASNGQEAMEIWDKYSPHLIFMDMRMPVMDGYEATKRIKATTKGQATAIIALTASSLEEERTIVLCAGCDDFIRKPFREAEIFDAMHKHLGVRYIYDEPAAAPSSTETKADILTPDALAALPPDLVANLYQAIIALDVELIQSFIAQIRELNEPLANAVASLAKNFQYDRLLNFIQPTPDKK